MYPVSTINWDIGETFASNMVFGGGEPAPWLQVLQELDMKRVIEGSRRYYVGALRPPPGVTFTQFGGFGYVPGDLSSSGPGTRTAVLVGVGWFNRQRQTTELVAHELGHNHGRQHAPGCGAANPDPAYPYTGAAIGQPGTDMYSQSLSGGSAPQLAPFSHFDVMSYCVPAWISDYSYSALLTARLAADPIAATNASARGAQCECLIVWGSIHGDSIALNPAFVTRTFAQPPSGTGPFVLEGIREDGSVSFTYTFAPSVIDHAPDVRHFTFAIPVGDADRDALATLRVRSPRRSVSMARAPGRVRQAVEGVALRPSLTGTQSELSWPGTVVRGALVRDVRTGAVLGISTGRGVTLPRAVDEVEVILSDGVRSESVRARRR
jgi:hypothetical protein